MIDALIKGSVLRPELNYVVYDRSYVAGEVIEAYRFRPSDHVDPVRVSERDGFESVGFAARDVFVYQAFADPPRCRGISLFLLLQA